MNFYKLESGGMFPDYLQIDPKSVPGVFKHACRGSAFQMIDPDEPLEVDLRESCGSEMPDFSFDPMLEIPFVSARMHNYLEELGVDYLLSKRIVLRDPLTWSKQECWLALPPKIDCLDYDKSEIDELECVAKKIVIRERSVGRFDIFRIQDSDLHGCYDPSILVTDRFKAFVDRIKETVNLKCLYFTAI